MAISPSGEMPGEPTTIGAPCTRMCQAGECPLVVDTSTPSCGNSRFGCWVCTVVQADHSMEAMIDNGEEWMEPLLEFRNLLASTQEPSEKQKYRQQKRRDGKIWTKADGSTVPGPYKLHWRQQFLRKLLEAQKKVREDGGRSASHPHLGS